MGMKMHNRRKLRCTAVILAGGQSRRMGRDKRFLTLEGESFIERMLRLASGFAEEVVISLATEEQASEICAGEFKVVLDESPGKGPAYALLTAAKHAAHEHIAVMPVDSPLLNPELYRILLQEVGGYEAAVPVVRGFPEPLHAVYRTRALLRVEAAQPRSARELLTLLNVNFVPEERLSSAGIDGLSFLNVNTPQEYTELRKRWKDAGKR